MEAWQTEAANVISNILGHPSSHMEAVIVSLITLMVFFFTLSKLSDGFKIPMTHTRRVVLVAVVTIAGLLASIVAANLYVLPKLSSPDMKQYAPWAAAALALLILCVPSMCLIQKAGYFQGLVSILLSIVVAGAIMIILQAGISTVRQSAMGVSEDKKEKTRGVDTVLEK